jgi:hypothetical protein
VELGGVGEPHAAFLTENRTRSHGWSHVQEIRVAPAYVGRKWYLSIAFSYTSQDLLVDMAKALVGFARLLRPTYAGANVGHPSSS